MNRRQPFLKEGWVATVLLLGALALAACGAPTPPVPGPPDLVVEQLAVVPAEAAPGSEVALTFTVRNAGGTAAAASTLRVLLGTAADDVGPNAALLAERPTAALEPDAEEPYAFNVTLPQDAAPGLNYLWVVADARDEAGQAERGNDRAVEALRVEYVACEDAASSVSFVDAALEAAVRTALGIPTAGLTCADMGTLTALDAPDEGIVSLDGLQHATALARLALSRNEISDLYPLENLAGLTELWLYDNGVSDLRPLAGLSALVSLSLEKNAVTDIGPLASLAGLRRVWLGTNKIADLGPLQELTDLAELHLLDNRLTDLAPLVANSGLASGDTLDVRYNCLDLAASSTASQQLAALTARGVLVESDPQKDCAP